MFALQNFARAHAGKNAGLGELAAAQADGNGTNQPRVIGPAQHGHDEGQPAPGQAVAQHEIKQHQDGQQRNDDEGVIDRHQHPVDPATLVTRDQAHQQRHDAAHDRHGDAEQQGVADRHRKLPEHVLAAAGGTEHMWPAGWLVQRCDVDVQRRIWREIGQHGDHQHDAREAGADGELDIGAQQITQGAPHQRASTRGSSKGYTRSISNTATDTPMMDMVVTPSTRLKSPAYTALTSSEPMPG